MDIEAVGGGVRDERQGSQMHRENTGHATNRKTRIYLGSKCAVSALRRQCVDPILRVQNGLFYKTNHSIGVLGCM